MIYLPILIPLIFAIATMFGWKSPILQKGLAITGSALLAGANLALLLLVLREGVQTAQIGNWPAPFGISLVVDLLSAILLLTTSLAALFIAIYSLGGIDPLRIRWGFYPLFFFLMIGVNGAFSTGDLFNLYVWFEVMLMASFVLIVLGGERRQLEGGLKYVILNLLSSMLFLSATGLIYHFTGALNYADLTLRMRQIQSAGIPMLIAVLFLAGFGIKAGLFPFFFWLPASYHTPPVTITALFSGLLTKVGFYAFLRIFTLLFSAQQDFLQPLLLVLAGFTMLTGVLGAAAQTDFRRLLSFHIISQIGYLIMGLALFTSAAIGAAIFFTVHVIFAKMALFLIAGMVYAYRGTYDLRRLGGLYRAHPALSLVFLLPAMALAGLPPLSGFFAKLLLILAGLEISHYLIVAVALVVSLLTLFSMTKIWNEVFWKPAPDLSEQKLLVQENRPKSLPVSMWIPVIALCVLVILMGVFANPLIEITEQAALGLLEPQAYIQQVLGGIK
jgi:multicomponent Na+:H+ antiporter subunit D